jgi:epoxyqueuosine reductase
MPNSISDIKAQIVREALAQGFDAVRVTGAEAAAHQGEALGAFLAAGHHGDMDWMAARQDWRANPASLWPAAKSAILLGVNYGPADDPLAVLAQADRGAISVYARGDDYHDLVKKKLKALGGFIARRFAAEVKVFVDTAPVMEKPLAAKAGIGWQGRHTNLVSREFGS